MPREAFIETSSTYIHVERRPEATCCFDHFQAGMKTVDSFVILIHVELVEQRLHVSEGFDFLDWNRPWWMPSGGVKLIRCGCRRSWRRGNFKLLGELVKLLGFWCENDSKWSRTSRSQDKKLTLEPVHRALIHIISSPSELHWFPMNQIQVSEFVSSCSFVPSALAQEIEVAATLRPVFQPYFQDHAGQCVHISVIFVSLQSGKKRRQTSYNSLSSLSTHPERNVTAINLLLYLKHPFTFWSPGRSMSRASRNSRRASDGRQGCPGGCFC